MVKVSIIVPIYNVEKYLRRCVDSLVNQTLKDIEIILINDASPDHCDDIMHEYERRYAEKVKCIYLKENIRQGGARNRGLEIAKGEYVTFVDSDDFADVTMCEKMYQEACRGDFDIVYCDYYDNFIDQNRLRYMSFVCEKLIGEITEEKRKALFFTTVTPYGKLIRTSLIKKYKIYFPEKMFYEDAATTLLFHMYAKRIGWVNEPLYYYTIRENSTVRQKNSEHQLDEAQAGLILYNRFKERGFYEKYRAEIDMIFLIYFYMHPLGTAVERFENPPLDYMRYLRDTVKQIYPHYEENPYYWLVEASKYYDYIRLNEDPEKFRKIIVEGKYSLEQENYIECYAKVKEKLQRLLQEYKINKYHIGIWGAGKRGRDFLKVCDPDKKYIDVVFDKNEKLIGTQMESGHNIVSFTENYDREQVIIGMNHNHYVVIKKEIEVLNKNIKFINLDLYMQFGIL